MVVELIVSVVVGIGISALFLHIDRKHQKEQKELRNSQFKIREEKCIDLLLGGLHMGPKPWTSRSKRILQLRSNMTDDDYNPFLRQSP